MMRRLLLFTSLALPACSGLIISHDELKAAGAAAKFAQTAFVSRDYAAAHGLLEKKARGKISLAELTEVVTKMHPNAFPTQVKATEFEPIPGQRAMNIYLVGQNGGEAFYYRLVMAGDANAGYGVASLLRGSGPYPGAKRPLPSPIPGESPDTR